MVENKIKRHLSKRISGDVKKARESLEKYEKMATDVEGTNFDNVMYHLELYDSGHSVGNGFHLMYTGKLETAIEEINKLYNKTFPKEARHSSPSINVSVVIGDNEFPIPKEVWYNTA